MHLLHIFDSTFDHSKWFRYDWKKKTIMPHCVRTSFKNCILSGTYGRKIEEIWIECDWKYSRTGGKAIRPRNKTTSKSNSNSRRYSWYLLQTCDLLDKQRPRPEDGEDSPTMIWNMTTSILDDETLGHYNNDTLTWLATYVCVTSMYRYTNFMQTTKDCEYLQIECIRHTSDGQLQLKMLYLQYWWPFLKNRLHC